MKLRDIPTDIKISSYFFAAFLLSFIPGLGVILISAAPDLLLAKIFSTKPRNSIKDKDDGSSAPPVRAE